MPPPEPIFFTGISQTSINGDPITNDPSDWGFGDSWTKRETALFPAGSSANCSPTFNYKITAYPNPGNGVFTLLVEKQTTTRVAMRLVDQNFNVLLSSDSIPGRFTSYDVRTAGIKDTMRLYYQFMENNCIFRGHGDIVVE